MDKTTCIVVGAGPAGSACALSLARKGIDTVLLERGRTPGEKKVSSFVLLMTELRRLIPDWEKDLPVERNIIRTDQAIFNGTDIKMITSYNYDKLKNPVYFSAFRRKFDEWFAKKAKEAGAELITGMTVTDLIMDNGRVVGVKIDDEELYADIVVGADGYHTKVGEKAGLVTEWDPARARLAVKEVLDLPPEVINERFQLSDGQGCDMGIIPYHFGELSIRSSTLYTNKDSISLAVFAHLGELKEKNIKLHDELEKFKEHPFIHKFIKGATLREYQAHIIPHGGRVNPENLYGDGVLLCGEAGGTTDTASGMGVPTCMTAGLMAAETIALAVKKKDFSADTLKNYLKFLDSTSILDMIYESKKTSDYWVDKGKLERPDCMAAIADSYNQYWNADYMSKDYHPLFLNLYLRVGKFFAPKLIRMIVTPILKGYSFYEKTVEKIKRKIRRRFYEWKKQYDN
ncbi:MAG: FAD-dependent oxidoreductase [Desulfobacterales bacterium]|nr:FAD-dependent oxidoreductase [Desulfobacterales bacterium]